LPKVKFERDDEIVILCEHATPEGIVGNDECDRECRFKRRGKALICTSDRSRFLTLAGLMKSGVVPKGESGVRALLGLLLIGIAIGIGLKCIWDYIEDFVNSFKRKRKEVREWARR